MRSDAVPFSELPVDAVPQLVPAVYSLIKADFDGTVDHIAEDAEDFKCLRVLSVGERNGLDRLGTI